MDIEDQIRNAQFMYPERPWAEISREAIACIQKLLVVQHEARYSVDQAMADTWLCESNCLADISKLEEEAITLLSCPPLPCALQVGLQWLTPQLEKEESDSVMEKTYF